MTQKKYIALTVLMLLFSIHLMADNRPYGMAGCGLGSMIVGKEGNQIVAMTSNGLGTQTFGISSGTSNCGQRAAKQTASYFIESNKVALSNDIARGEGEALVSLANVYGCSEVGQFSSTLQKNYEKIFTKPHLDGRMINFNIQQVVKDNGKNLCKFI